MSDGVLDSKEVRLEEIIDLRTKLDLSLKKNFNLTDKLQEYGNKDHACYATNSQNRRKDRSTTSKSASSRGHPPLHYTNE